MILYFYLSRRHLLAPWSDVRSGLFVTLAEWAAKRVSDMPGSQERAWKPSVLAPVQSVDELRASYRFLKALTYPRGSVRVLGLHPSNEALLLEGLSSLTRALVKEGIFSQATVVEANSFEEGLHTCLDVLKSVFFRPNILFLPVREETDEAFLVPILTRARANEIGAVLYARHPITSLGREQAINVWIRAQAPEWEVALRLSNLDLSLLLAYQIARNWGGQINLITVVDSDEEQEKGEAFLKELTKLGRMPHDTQTIAHVGSLMDYLPQAPQGDLNIFGMQSHQVDLDFVHKMVKMTNSSCIFVRDSGHESALA